MLVAEPNDTFLRYGLALEFAREGQPDEAVSRLRALVADRPDYVPAYFQAAQLLLQTDGLVQLPQLQCSRYVGPGQA